MLKTKLLFIFLLIASLSFGQTGAVLLGKIKNPQTNYVQVSFVTNQLNGDKEVFRVLTQNDDTEFIANVEIDKPTLISISHNRKMMYMYVKPGRQYNISFDGYNPKISLVVNDPDTGLDFDNDCLQKFVKEFDFINDINYTFMYPSMKILAEDSDLFYSMPTSNAFRYMEITKGREQKHLELCPNLSDDFRQFMKDHTTYRWLSYQLRIINPTALSFDLGPKYTDNFNKKEVNNKPAAIDNPAYTTYIDEYLLNQYKRIKNLKKFDYNKEWKEIYDVVTQDIPEIDEEVKAFFLGRLLYLNVNPGSAVEVQNYITDYFNKPESLPYQKTLLSKFEYAKKFGDGSPAMPFEVINRDGEVVTLESLQGKYVYLSFWAKWCSKCIEEMYATESNKSTLNQDSVAYVYISLDADSLSWQEHKVLEDIKGEHLWAKTVKAPVAESYGVFSLPRYFLIDANSTFVAPFKKASDPDFTDYLKGLLKDRPYVPKEPEAPTPTENSEEPEEAVAEQEEVIVSEFWKKLRTTIIDREDVE